MTKAHMRTLAHRFVFFTDLHHKGNRRLLDSMVRRINALSLEFVCFGGDLIEENGHLADALDGLKRVALIHYPLWIEKLVNDRFDVALAGHSHGGQVRLPFIGPVVIPFGVGRYDLGLFHTPSGPLHVGAGIGWFYLNVRFRCRPELTVVEI